LAELVALQEQLITAVAAHLHVKVRILEGERALKATGDLTVHQILLRAESMLQGKLTAAVAEARRAVEIAPDHGLAHAVLASGLGMQLLEAGGDDPALHEEIQTVVGRALALSPNDPAAIWRCASALVFVGRPDDGLHHIDRVLALTPDNPMAFHVLSLIHIRLGKGDEALSSLGSWERLAPGSRLLFISLHLKALAHFLRGEQDSAIDVIDRAFRLNPQYSMTLLTRAALKSLAGAADDARASVRALRLVEPSTLPERFENRATMMVAPWASTALNKAFRKVWDETLPT
jgi:tetratricopeptide (TPR) repeat protein